MGEGGEEEAPAPGPGPGPANVCFGICVCFFVLDGVFYIRGYFLYAYIFLNIFVALCALGVYLSLMWFNMGAFPGDTRNDPSERPQTRMNV